MEFGFAPSFIGCIHERQRFRKHRQSCLWLSYGSICLGKECEVIRSQYLCSRGTPGCQALGHLFDAFLRLSLLRQCPATHDRTDCHLVGETLFLRKADEGFGVLLGATRLTTELMAQSCTTQDITQTIGVDNVLRQGHRLIVPCPSL